MTALLRRISGFTTVRALQAFQLLRFAGFFITGILLAKSSTDIYTIGVYETLMFVSAATGFFWVSGILNSLLASYNATDDRSKGKMLYHTLLLLCVLNVVLVIILKLFESDILLLTGNGIAPYYNQLLIYLLLNNPAFLAEYVLLLREKKRSLLLYGFLVSGLSILVTILPFYTGGSLHTSLTALIAIAACKFVFSAWLLTHSEFSYSELTGIRKQLKLAAPLVSGLLISGSAEYIDGFLVTSHFGEQAFAAFRYGAREFPITLLMANALSMAMVPVIAGQRDEGMLELKREGRKLMHWFAIPVCILMLFSSSVYPIVFRPEFIESAGIFNIYLLLLISRMIFPQTVVMAQQSNHIVFRVALVELTANVFFSILLLNLIGIKGVAYGTVIAFTLEKALLVVYLAKRKKISPEAYTDLRTWMFYCVLLLVSYYVSL